MGLISLIDNLDSATKTKLLGKEITKILRYTFAENDYDTLDNEILNEAVAIQLGSKLIKSKRELLIESIRTRDLNKLSFSDFGNAIEFYKKVLFDHCSCHRSGIIKRSKALNNTILYSKHMQCFCI